MTSLTIGQLASAAGVPTSTVRYYERAGLVKPDFRTGGNYRGYGAATLERLKFIRSAQAIGLSLGDVRRMLELANDSREPCREVVQLAEKRLAEVRQQLKHLKTVEKMLAKAVKHCCSHDDGLCNRVVHLKKICPPACTSNPRA